MVANENKAVATAAHEQGFILSGFASIRPLAEREPFFRDWLNSGRHGSMAYLARAPERRFDPRSLDSRLRTVISLAYPYHCPAPPEIDWRAQLRGRIAAYALGPDYHDVVLKKARAVAEAITAIRPGSVARVYVDTGPVFEREWAIEAGIGWLGKNTMLLNRKQGSYFFLAEIFTDAEFEPAGATYRQHCGRCTRCLELCPTGALEGGYVMDARKCISYLTIENRGPIPSELRSKLGNWIFGCDICQEVCPWNEPFTEPIEPALLPYLPDLLALDQESYSRRFAKSAIKRAKRAGLLRNAAVALGNGKNPAAAPFLARALASDPDPLIRSHAAWALGQIGGPAAKRALDRARKSDPDAETVRECEAALSGDGGAAAAGTRHR